MRFILVDDETACNMISRFTLRRAFGDGISVDVFDQPENALSFIHQNYLDKGNDEPTVVFLDINMPTLTGWEFLDEYAKFGSPVHQHFTIYMLTSSIDVRDKELAANSPFVKGFLSKPLSVGTLQELFER